MDAPLNAPVNNQFSSPLFRLPAEIREAIYSELWLSAGTSQHIFWHEDKKDPSNSRCCLWPCTTETDFSAEDSLQTQLEQVWEDHERPHSTLDCDKIWGARLNSRWYNHWACEERMLQACHEDNITVEPSGSKGTHSQCSCVARPTRHQYPYLPMLLSCKRLYAECVESMFRATKFVLIGMNTVEKLLGKHRKIYDAVSFHRNVRHLELSLLDEFKADMPCCAEWGGSPHTPYDFRWLNLGEMANCRQINVWISARRRSIQHSRLGTHVTATNLDAAALGATAAGFCATLPRCRVHISAPLGRDITPEHGVVENVPVDSRVRIWKRYTGDKFRSTGGARICVRPDRSPFPIIPRFSCGLQRCRSRR